VNEPKVITSSQLRVEGITLSITPLHHVHTICCRDKQREQSVITLELINERFKDGAVRSTVIVHSFSNERNFERALLSSMLASNVSNI